MLFLYAYVPREDARTMSRVAAAFARARRWIRPETLESDVARYAAGDGRAILGAASLLDHPDTHVREGAVKAIAEHCAEDDDLALRAVAWRLVSDGALSETEAVRALESLPPRGDNAAIQLLVSRKETDASKRALLGKLVVAMEGSGFDFVDGMLSYLQVGSATAEDDEDEAAFKLSTGVESWLTRSPDKIRRPARADTADISPHSQVTLQTLDAEAASLGRLNLKAWKYLRDQALQFSYEVRLEILQVLREAADHGPEHALDVVAEKMEDAHSDVREGALLLLWLLAPKGDHKAIDIALSGVRDEVRDVRSTAVQVVAKVAEKGDFYTFQSLSGSLGDRDAFVRQETVRAMGDVANPSDGRNLELLLEVLSHESSSPEAKASAVQVVALATEPDDARAQRILSEHAESEHTLVSSTSSQMISQQLSTRRGTTKSVSEAWHATWQSQKRRGAELEPCEVSDAYAESPAQRPKAGVSLLALGELGGAAEEETFVTATVNTLWAMFNEKEPAEQPAFGRSRS